MKIPAAGRGRVHAGSVRPPQFRFGDPLDESPSGAEALGGWGGVHFKGGVISRRPQRVTLADELCHAFEADERVGGGQGFKKIADGGMQGRAGGGIGHAAVEHGAAHLGVEKVELLVLAAPDEMGAEAATEGG